MTSDARAPHAAFDAAIGLGSNIGDKVGNIERAIDLLCADGALRLVARSRLYRSAPWGVTTQDWFVNACLTVATELSARDVLRRCQAVENALGRVRFQKWGPRLIDCDVLTYRDAVISEPDFIVPHPLIGARAFVLVPLMDVAGDIAVGGRRLSQWLADVDARDVVALDAADDET
ncbi:MAG: 2-amino-4-hydroxy-6-hydroxymethyldihydropteridine diphosphokinase [Hyphomicrobium sp.]